MKKRKSCIMLAILMIWGLVLANVALATDTVLHSFEGGANDGASPFGDLIISDGYLYGMTSIGGGVGCTDGCGTIFKIATTGGAINLLYSFTGGNDGATPTGSLILGGDGYLYGMTSSGGGGGFGTIFKISTTDGTFTLIHTFNGGANDGASPRGSLILDGGNL